jgi:hypothetical protein
MHREISHNVHLAQWNQHSFHECARFEKCFPQRLIQVEVKPLVLGDVVSHTREQHQVVESLCHFLCQIGCKNSGSLVNSSRTPFLRVCKQHFLVNQSLKSS